MQSEIMRPLGMTRTAYRWTEELRRDAAVPYSEWGEPLPYEAFSASAAAGLVTTVGNMSRLALASLSTQGISVLSPRTIRLMETPVVEAPNHMGLGYFVDVLPNGDREVGHAGSNPGWQALYLVVPSRRAGLVLLTNSSNGGQMIRALTCDWMREITASELKRYCLRSIGAKLFTTTLSEGVEAAAAQ